MRETAAKPEAIVYEPTRWSLDELLPDATDATVGARFEEIEKLVAAFERRRAELTSEISPETVLELVRDVERLIEKQFVLSAFGSLEFSSDTQSAAALNLRNRIEQRLTDWQNRTLFFDLWWKGLSEEAAERLMPDGEAHADYRYYLTEMRRFRPFTLDERSEQIVNLKDANGVDALVKLYSILTNRLEFRLEVDGESRTLTRDEITSYVFSPRPELREAAYRELLAVWEREATVLGEIYVHRVRDWESENLRLRGYSSPIEVRHLANDVPAAAVDAVLQVTRENRVLFHRYFRAKAAWMGRERLRRFDIYAPLGESDRRVQYGESVRLVLDTFDEFHPEFARRARRVFDEGHIDAEVRKGKRGGAFCATVLPRQTPWLLVNHVGRVRDTATLAHELGHAVHSMLAEEHSVLTQHASLPLAETASVFAEMLLTERMLRDEPSAAVQRELLGAALDDVFSTVLRQAYFVLFELEAHAAIGAGRSTDELHSIYLRLLEEQFGDAVEIAPEFRCEWLAIPHIYHSPFYCYAYSFGQLLVLALYRRYQEEGEAFLPGYLSMLARGGSAPPREILAEVGVDITDPGFWRGGFDVVESLLERLEALQA